MRRYITIAVGPGFAYGLPIRWRAFGAADRLAYYTVPSVDAYASGGYDDERLGLRYSERERLVKAASPRR